jgi:hypothetical protein
MGTQQVFLLVVAAMIVGLALAAGMDQFNASAQDASRDQMRNEAARVAKHAQAWYRSPEVIGGGGRSFAGFNFEKINYDSSKVAGVLALSHVQSNTFRLTATLHDEPAWRLVMNIYPDSVVAGESE